MSRRLDIAKGPAWRHWSESRQPGILGKNRFRIGRKQEVAVELATLGAIHEVAALVAAAERDLSIPWVVEEQPVASRAHDERDGHVGTGSIAVVAVPESPGGAVLV